MSTTKTSKMNLDRCIDCCAPTYKLVWSLDDDLNDIEVPVCIDCADENIDGLDEDDDGF